MLLMHNVYNIPQSGINLMVVDVEKCGRDTSRLVHDSPIEHRGTLHDDASPPKLSHEVSRSIKNGSCPSIRQLQRTTRKRVKPTA